MPGREFTALFSFWAQFTERDADGAARWWQGLVEAVLSLEPMPLRCSLAPEVPYFEEEVRMLLYRRRIGQFRILFTVRGLDLIGALASLARGFQPLMAAFNLPPESALSVVLGSVRIDGIAIGLLDSSWRALKVPLMSSGQLLTCVYLASFTLPCLVTLHTIAKEISLP